MQIEILPILTNNYVFVIKAAHVNHVTLVDPGEYEICLDYLKSRDLVLKNIFITHHHNDHTDGIIELKKHFPEAIVYAPQKNKNDIPLVDIEVVEGHEINFEHNLFKVLELPGHTLGHVAYFNPSEHALFSGDVLFGLGCGRLFGGSPKQMFESLKKIKDLSEADLKIYCTHEYTEMNLKFLESLIAQHKISGPFNDEILFTYKENLFKQRKAGLPSIPLSLTKEIKLNPFLMTEDLSTWTKLRERRNDFKFNPT